MTNVNYEITKEEYDKAVEGSPYDLIGDDVQMGYGAYCARVYEAGGHYYLSYDQGSSCD